MTDKEKKIETELEYATKNLQSAKADMYVICARNNVRAALALLRKESKT